MAVKRLEHVGLVVEDLAAAIEFFLALGFELQGEMSMDDRAVDRIVALEDVRTDFAFVSVPGGQGSLELIKFNSPPSPAGDPDAPANAPGLRHIALLVDDVEVTVAGLRARGVELVGEVVNYEDSYILCYVRGPEGIIVELAEKLG